MVKAIANISKKGNVAMRAIDNLLYVSPEESGIRCITECLVTAAIIGTGWLVAAAIILM